MPKKSNNKETSETVAGKAAKILKDKDASPEAKSVAASALTQAAPKKAEKSEAERAEEAILDRCAALEEADKAFVDPHAAQKAVMEFGSVAEMEAAERAKARKKGKK